MITIVSAVIAGCFALFAAVISISKHIPNHVREFNNSLDEYEKKYYRNDEIREIYRDRAAESLLNMKGVKAKIVDLFFYDEELEKKVYLVTKFKFYFDIAEDYSHVSVNKMKLNISSSIYLCGYIILFSYISWQFLDFNSVIDKFNQYNEKGNMINIFNWIMWDSILAFLALFCIFMCVRIQEIRIFEKSKLYKILL